MTLSDGMWSGQSCLIVGGGPSVKAIPRWEKWLEWISHAPLMGESAYPRLIAVNRAFEFVNYPDLWIGLDSIYWRKKVADQFHQSATRFGTPRVWVDHGERHPGDDKVDVVLPCAAPPETPNRHAALAWGRSLAEGVGCGGNSGFAALNLADILGAETIYLLGFDMKGENGRVTHFHDGYKGEKPPSDDLCVRWLAAFRWAATQCRAKVVVLEVSPGDSALDCWEKKLVGEVL